jgi:UDP-GlcNAc:undecaprenyl-phosphate/decaprenyl-phosphate GlcNAc-1-phosphate transferase
MKTYLAIFMIAAFAAGVLTPLLRRFCQRYGLVDAPVDQRRVHRTAVPRLGGVAIFLSLIISLSSLLLLNNLLTQNVRSELKPILSLAGCGVLVLLVGAYDDLRGLGPWTKLIALMCITTLFFGLGGRIQGLSIPFVGQVGLHPIAGFALTLLWVVGITNAFNLIDGVDGLAAGSALFSSLVLLTNSLIQGNAEGIVVALALSGALAGFLRYNFNPASIFLGDSGSLLVGFVLAALSVQGSQKASTAVAVAIPILAFGLPVVDTGVTVARRLLSGKPMFIGDREHIHHMLLARGWSQRRVALSLYAVSAGFGLAAMLFVNSGSGIPAVLLFVIGAAIVLALGNLRYHEVDELRASVKRNIGDRRLRAINNLRIRRACQSLSTANTLNELFNAIIEVGQSGEFVCAAAQLSCNGHALINARAIELALENDDRRDFRMFEGQVKWEWEGTPEALRSESRTDGLWTINLPISVENSSFGYLTLARPLASEPLLFDVSYLTNVFQPAMARAAQRIFAHAEQSMPRQRAATAR